MGLVTSNARHGPATLPRLAFCIAGQELQPVLDWAARHAAEGEGGGLAALRALDVRDEAAERVWRLEPPLGWPAAAQRERETEAPRSRL